MNPYALILCALLLLAHIIFAAITTTFIQRSNLIEQPQKRLNIILTWVFPIVWALVARTFLKPEASKTITKADRKVESHKFRDNGKTPTRYIGNLFK